MTITSLSRSSFLSAVDLFDSRVAATPADRWASPSPCEGWTARDIVAHLVTNLQALRAALDGGDFFDSFGRPVEGDVVAAWVSERAAVASSVDRAGETDLVIVGGNQVPTAAMVDGLMRDLVIHTWDLARAVGGDERLPEAMVAAASKAMAAVGPESRGPGLYGPEVQPPADADAQTRVLALSGRKAF